MADPNTLDPAEGSGLAGLLRAITAAETCDFADARPLAAQAYHSEALLRWEIEHLFRKEWIRAGREDDVPSPADFLTTEVAGTPIILIRQEDGGMRAFLNACAHRHTKLTNRWRGHSRLLVCPVMPGPIVSSRGSQRSPDIHLLWPSSGEGSGRFPVRWSCPPDQTHQPSEWGILLQHLWGVFTWY